MECHSASRRSPARVSAFIGLVLAFLLILGNPLAVSAALQPDKTEFPGTSQTDEGLDEFEDAGLTSETTYESPQFGFEAEWDDPWFVDPAPDSESVVSDETTNPPNDYLRLTSADNGERIAITGYALEGSWFEDLEPDEIPAAHIADLEDYEPGDSSVITSIDVLLTEESDDMASVLYLITWEDGDQFISANEIRVFDDYFVTSFFSAPPLEAAEVYESGQDEIEIDGDPAFDLLESRDVADAIEEAIEEFDLEEGSSGDPDETDTDDDLTFYYDGVRGAAGALIDTVDRFLNLLNSDEELTDADVDEINGILDTWESAPNLAIAGDPPDGVEDIHEILLDFLDTLVDTADAFVAYVQGDDDERDELVTEFNDLLDEVYALYDDLIAEIDAAEE